MRLEAFELVLLRRPPDATGYDEETLARIQQEHLTYLDELRAAGHIVANGPVIDQPDESLRGVTIFRTGSVAEARRLAEADPAVRAGRLSVEAMAWWCPPGSMAQPGSIIEIDEAQ